MSKMIFVLTKADSLISSPWYMSYNNPFVKFSPSMDTSKLIQGKQAFFLKQLIQPFGEHIVSHTDNDANFSLNEPSFEYDENKVTYRGILTRQRVNDLSEIYPEYRAIFERL